MSSNKPTETRPQPSPKKRSFGKDVLKLASGASVAQAFNFLITPILTRLFPPESFGVASEFVAIATILGIVATLRYELAIMLPQKEEEAANVLAMTLGVVAVTSLSVAVGFLLIGNKVLKLAHLEELIPYWPLFPLVMALAGALQAFSYWHSRHQRFGDLAIMRMLRAIGRNSVALGAGLLQITSATGLILGTLGGYLLGDLFLLIKMFRLDATQTLRALKTPHILKSLKRYRKFPLYSSWGGILNSLSWQVPVLLLGAYFSAEVVGFYGLSRTLLQVPTQLVGMAISEVFYQRAASISPEELGDLFQSLFARLVRFGVFPILLLAFALHDLAGFFLGPKWNEVGEYAQILSFSIAASFFAAPSGRIFSVLERQEATLIINALFLVGRTGAIWLGHVMGSPLWALGLFSGISFVLYVGYSLWAFHVIGKHWTAWLAKLMPVVLLSGSVLGLLLLLRTVSTPSPWLWLIIYGLIAIIYAVWLVFNDHELHMQIQTWLNTWRRNDGSN